METNVPISAFFFPDGGRRTFGPVRTRAGTSFKVSAVLIYYEILPFSLHTKILASGDEEWHKKMRTQRSTGYNAGYSPRDFPKLPGAIESLASLGSAAAAGV